LIETIHSGSRGTYGAPRVHADLWLEHGVATAKKRVARIMAAAGLEGCHRRRRRATTTSDPSAAPAPDLVDRGFAAPQPDRLWVTDITYVPTRRGFCYLAAVLDVYSRKIVGYAVDDSIATDIVHRALDVAVARRDTSSGLVLHSDRGCQFTSLSLGRRLTELGISPSMGGAGDCYDNAMIESFFATLECELIDRTRFEDRTQARLQIFSFIEGFYNPRRRHSALDYLSPDDYERRHFEAHPAPLESVH
jgi:putative transposase